MSHENGTNKNENLTQSIARKYYAANRGRVIELVRQYKIRNDPSHGLFAAVAGFERGDLSFEQFVEIYGERIALLDDLFKPEA